MVEFISCGACHLILVLEQWIGALPLNVALPRCG
jgi:hypothetical protein